MGFDIAGVATLSAPGGNTLSLDGTVANIMKVNANGILTRSITPYMRGQITGQATNPYNAGGGPLLVIADVNTGNCWNNATGYFTCPVAGYYMAVMGSIAGPVSTAYPRIRKNGADYHYTHWNHASNWHFVSISAVVLCAASDNICFAVASYNPATAGVYGAGGHQMYSIALLA